MIAYLRKLRHGPLAKFSSIWLSLGNIYRKIFSRYVKASQYIGPYGPFLVDGEFAFSNFKDWGGGHNNGFEKCIEAARGKKCFLDIGGHIGLVSMPASKVMQKTGFVYAFEPAAANVKHLKSHVTLNKIENIVIVESLVGDKNNDATVFFEQTKATGQNALVIKKNHKLFLETERPQITLDYYCQKNNLSPEIIKIDVEGAELNVLMGAQNIIKQNKPVIFLSLHPVEIGLLGATVEEVVSFINDNLDYSITEVEGDEVKEYRLAEYLLCPK